MAEPKELTIEELTELLEHYDIDSAMEAQRKKFDLQQIRKSRPWIRDMISVLYPRPNGLKMDDLVTELWSIREKTLPMPREFSKSVQSRLNHYTSQSAVFQKRNAQSADDLFFSPKGKGSGTWAVNRSRAEAWLRRKRLR